MAEQCGARFLDHNGLITVDCNLRTGHEGAHALWELEAIFGRWRIHYWEKSVEGAYPPYRDRAPWVPPPPRTLKRLPPDLPE